MVKKLKFFQNNAEYLIGKVSFLGFIVWGNCRLKSWRLQVVVIIDFLYDLTYHLTNPPHFSWLLSRIWPLSILHQLIWSSYLFFVTLSYFFAFLYVIPCCLHLLDWKLRINKICFQFLNFFFQLLIKQFICALRLGKALHKLWSFLSKNLIQPLLSDLLMEQTCLFSDVTLLHCESL